MTPLPPTQRIRLAGTFALAEGVMPAVGLLLGLQLGSVLGEWSASLAGVLLVGIGGWMWRQAQGEDEDENGEAAKIAAATTTVGWSVVGLALSVSLDELTIWFSFSALGFPLVPALILITLQALPVSLVGQGVGKHAGKNWASWQR